MMNDLTQASIESKIFENLHIIGGVMKKEITDNRLIRALLRAVMAAAIVFAVFTLKTDRAYAASGFVIVYTAESTDVKAQPDEDSKTIANVGKDTSFFVSGNAGNGWYKATYNGSTCYLKANKLKILKAKFNGNPATILGAGYQSEVYSVEENAPEGAEGDANSADADTAAAEEVLEGFDLNTMTFSEETQKELAKEFEEASEDAVKQETEVNRVEDIRKKSVIWKVIIGIIIAAMFAVGIVSVVLKKKQEAEDAENSNGDTKASDGMTEEEPAGEETAEKANEVVDSADDSAKESSDEMQILDLDSDESLNK